MLGFKNYVNSAIVKPSPIVDELNKLQKSAKDALDLIQQAIKIIPQNVSESRFAIQDEAEKYVLVDQGFLTYMKTNFQAEPFKNRFGFQKSCGKDGCAYYFTNEIIVKFTKDHKEFKIAKQVAGYLKRLPIIAAIELEIDENESMLYAIVMRELNTVFYAETSYHVAYSIFSDVMHNLMDLVEKKPNIPIEYIRKRLTTNYMIRGMREVDPKILPYLEDLIRAIRVVYIKSGYLLGADWTGRNIGQTKKFHIQPFDFGRPAKHSLAVDQLPNKESQKIIIPKNSP